MALGQKSGYLLVNGEPRPGYLKVTDAEAKPVLLYGTSRKTAETKVSAYEAEAAYIPGEWKFVSFYLPDSEERVWGKCHFEGKYSLVEYKGVYFFVDGKTSTALIGNVDNDGVPKYKIQMAALLNGQVNYNYNGLSYQPDELVKPLTQMHELGGNSYDIYEAYRENKSHTYMELEYSTLDGLIYLNDWGQINPEGVAANIGIGQSFNIPKLSEKLFITIGGRLGLYHFDEELYMEYPGIEQNIQFVRNILVPSINGGLQLDLIDVSAFKLTLKGSLDARKMLGEDTELHIANSTEGNIDVEHRILRVKNEWLIFHNYQVLIGFPWLSDSVQLGVGKSFCLSETDQNINEISIDNTLNFKFQFRF